MRLLARLILYLAFSLALVTIAFSYYQVYSEKLSLKNELQKKSELLADSLEQNIAPVLGAASPAQLQQIADRFANKDDLAGIVIYDASGARLAMTAGLNARAPEPALALPKAGSRNTGFMQFLRRREAWLQIYAVPLHRGSEMIGTLLVVHDASYIRAQLHRAWRDMLLRLLLQISLLALITFLVVQRRILRPIAHTASWMKALRTGRAHPAPALAESGVFSPLATEAATFAQTLVAARASAEQEARLRHAADSFWTAQRLCVYLGHKLKGARLFIASNREPYMHVRRGKSVEAIVPASGLVTALEPVLRACDGTWVAHGSGDADRETVDHRHCLRVPPDDPRYTLRRVWLTKEEEEGYYYGFSNEGLWPLCHIAHTRPTFRAADWEQYKLANAKFADALLEEMRGVPQPIVVVQDYHFALLPRLIKQQRPDARVAIFWHIPWPNPEAFGICPWQRELLDGLLGADLVGFHIQMHCDNFLETVNSALEARVEWERFAVNREGHLTMVRPFPISVVFPEEAPAQAKPFHVHQAELLKEIGADALYLGVGVDRVDYTKGILERLQGVERFLEKYPNYQGKFSFVQIGAPSRTRIKRYHDFSAECASEAERINLRFQSGKWKPIVFRNRHHNHQEVERFYRAADFCLVTSLHDGMNLVAKEYLAARHDEDGVLILSPFTGASRELADALIVNPYDTEQLADAIHAALEMEPAERTARMRRTRRVVKERNVYRWAGSLIGELCEVRVAERKRAAAPQDQAKSLATTA
jgi:trehalose 6-phosphate synthase